MAKELEWGATRRAQELRAAEAFLDTFDSPLKKNMGNVGWEVNSG